jgi:hypothetical protein
MTGPLLLIGREVYAVGDEQGATPRRRTRRGVRSANAMAKNPATRPTRTPRGVSRSERARQSMAGDPNSLVSSTTIRFAIDPTTVRLPASVPAVARSGHEGVRQVRQDPAASGPVLQFGRP